jgi:hypothetical protein
LALAVEGERQVILVNGEAGVGKTTLLDALVTEGVAAQVFDVLYGQCLQQHVYGEPYFPLLTAIASCVDASSDGAIADALRRHAPTWAARLPSLNREVTYEEPALSRETAAHERMLREFVEFFETCARRKPTVLVLDDLQWADPATLDAVAFLARRRHPASLAIVASCGPTGRGSSAGQVKPLIDELRAYRLCKVLSLGAFDQTAVDRYVASRFSLNDFPAAFGLTLRGRTEGNPLFLVALIDDLIGARIVHRVEDRWRLASDPGDIERRTPETIRAFVDVQMEWLPELQRRVLLAGSLAVGHFTAREVAAALAEDPLPVEDACHELGRRHHFIGLSGADRWPDGTAHSRYSFVHALYREIASDRVPPERRSLWHARMAAFLSEVYAEQTEEIAPALALHLERSGDREHALHYHGMAAARALPWAPSDAVEHFTHGLALLRELPPSRRRDVQELEMQRGLSRALVATQGYGAWAVEAANERTVALEHDLNPTALSFSTMHGVYLQALMRADFRVAKIRVEQLIEAVTGQANDGLLALALSARASLFLVNGQHVEARIVLREALARAEANRKETAGDPAAYDPAVGAALQLSVVEHILGYPGQALVTAIYAVELAAAAAVPLVRISALASLARTHRNRQEPGPTEALAQRALALAREHRIPFWEGEAQLLLGWAQVALGRSGGMQQVESGLAARLAAAAMGTTALNNYVAEACLIASDVARGLRAVDDALRFAREHEELAWAGEALRLRAELLLRQAELEPAGAVRAKIEAEECAHEALRRGRAQSAKMFELRAARVLHRIYRDQGKAREAHDLLAEAYDWFEGAEDVPDLAAAAALLRETK